VSHSSRPSLQQPFRARRSTRVVVSLAAAAVLLPATLTAPYMHDGSLATLEEVVDWYDGGGGEDPGRDRTLKPLGLDATAKRQLVAFLRTLTSDGVARLASEARASTGAFRERKL